MAEYSNDPLRSLLTKLSAVRVTLTDEEQSLLDQLILSSTEEVQAHSKIALVKKPIQTGTDEVTAQSLHATKPVATKPVATSPDEVTAQALQATKPVATKPVATSPDEASAQALYATKPVATRPVATSPEEVAANRLAASPDEISMMAEDEVLANRMLFFGEVKATEADEVSAHSMPGSLVTTAIFPNPVWVKIIYDPEMECYRID